MKMLKTTAGPPIFEVSIACVTSSPLMFVSMWFAAAMNTRTMASTAARMPMISAM